MDALRELWRFLDAVGHIVVTGVGLWVMLRWAWSGSGKHPRRCPNCDCRLHESPNLGYLRCRSCGSDFDK